MFPRRVNSSILSNGGLFSSEGPRSRKSGLSESFAEDTEQFFQLPPVAKKFRCENDAGAKQFPSCEKQAELLQVKTENAKLQSKLSAINQELVECKIQQTNDRENFTREKLQIESKSRTLERQVNALSEKENEWKSLFADLKKEAEKSNLNLKEKNRELMVSNEALEQNLRELTLEMQAKIQLAQENLLSEKKQAVENKCLVEHLEKRLELCLAKNSELEICLKSIKKQFSQCSRKCEEQAITIMQWRDENQVATVLRHDVQDLKALKQENLSLKEQLQRYKNLSENTALIKQGKAFLEEEQKRLNQLLEKYVNENCELTMALSKQSQKTEANSQNLGTSRRSLGEIDALTARCVTLKQEAQQKSDLIESLRAEILEKTSKMEEMRSQIGMHRCKVETTETASQFECALDFSHQDVENLQAEIRMKNEKIDYLMKKLGLTLDYNPETTRILHMDRNPLDLAHQSYTNELSSLREANKMLNLRLEELEKFRRNILLQQSEKTMAPISSDPTPSSNESVTLNVKLRVEDLSKDDQLTKLKAEISKLKEQRDRVAQKYQEIGSHYREACTFLTGYNIKLIEGQLVTVQSIYERTLGEQRHFEIQKNANEEYQLLGNEYAKEWENDFIEMYLKNDNSFPAFFAAVTLNLYNKDKSRFSLTESVG